MQMAPIYRSIFVLMPFRKSAGTLRTCPDLFAIIFDKFNFWVFRHIFEKNILTSLFQQYAYFVVRLTIWLQNYTETRFCPQFCFFWKTLRKILSNEPYIMLIRREFESVVIIVHFYENWSFVTK